MYFEGEIIRSRQNKNVVELCRLSDRRAREAARLFRFDGIKLLEEAVKKELEVTAIFVRASETEKIGAELVKRCGKGVFDRFGRTLVIADEIFDRISEEKSPEGVISIAKYIDKFQKNVTIYNSADFLNEKKQRIVLLESVRDPSNIGAIIRSAAAMGVERLIVSADCADIYNARAVRASMGTLFDQRIDRVADLPAAIEALKAGGRRVFAAALDSDAMVLGQFDLQEGDCVVIGNEGHGISEKTRAACSHSVIIPMSSRAESFNAAVAASLLMWEFSKKSANR